ncbi:unnamed protein product [Amoebophrya sp. A120]|nr:unnamed protein product [Amoebophrya sp. A120]|eukprot:GSA120T00010732001.1
MPNHYDSGSATKERAFYPDDIQNLPFARNKMNPHDDEFHSLSEESGQHLQLDPSSKNKSAATSPLSPQNLQDLVTAPHDQEAPHDGERVSTIADLISTSHLFGYLGLTLLVGFQGQLVVLDYLHNNVFTSGNIGWAETSTLTIAAAQCFAIPLFTWLRASISCAPSRVRHSQCEQVREFEDERNLQKLFALSCLLMITCSVTFFFIVLLSSSTTAAAGASTTQTPATSSEQRAESSEQASDTLKNVFGYSSLLLLGCGQQFFMSSVLAVAAKQKTEAERAQYAWSKGTAISGVPGLVLMWIFPKPGKEMALAIFVCCFLAVIAAFVLAEKKLFGKMNGSSGEIPAAGSKTEENHTAQPHVNQNTTSEQHDLVLDGSKKSNAEPQEHEHRTSPSDTKNGLQLQDVTLDGDAATGNRRSSFASSSTPPSTEELASSSQPRLKIPTSALSLASLASSLPELSVYRRVFQKTWRVVVGVFLLFFGLHCIWPAVVLAIWPLSEERDPDRVQFKVLLTMFIVGDLAGRFTASYLQKDSSDDVEECIDVNKGDENKESAHLHAGMNEKAGLEDVAASATDENGSPTSSLRDQRTSQANTGFSADVGEQTIADVDTSKPTFSKEATTTGKGTATEPTNTTASRDEVTASRFFISILVYCSIVIPVGVIVAVINQDDIPFVVKPVLLFLFSLKWAYTSSVAYALGPKMVSTVEEKGIAGPMVGQALVFGIFLGLLVLRFGLLEVITALEG